jgi:hypothetical protein
MTVQIPITLTPVQYRQLLAIAEKRGVQAHVLVEQLVAHALDPASKAVAAPTPRRSRNRPRGATQGGQRGRPKIPVSDLELAQIRDWNQRGRGDPWIAEQLGWSEYRARHYRKNVLGLPSVQEQLRPSKNTNQEERTAA